MNFFLQNCKISKIRGFNYPTASKPHQWSLKTTDYALLAPNENFELPEKPALCKLEFKFIWAS